MYIDLFLVDLLRKGTQRHLSPGSFLGELVNGPTVWGLQGQGAGQLREGWLLRYQVAPASRGPPRWDSREVH